MQRIALLIALVVAVLVDGFFALVNFYPVAPPRSRGPRWYVYAEFSPSQARWFQTNILDAFNDEHNVDVRLRVLSEEELVDALSVGGGPRDALLTVLPTELAAQAARRRAVRPFADALAPAMLQGTLTDLQPEVTAGAVVNTRQWFIPRSAVLDVGVYRISRVRDAELHWPLLRSEIDAGLRAVNGRGLPMGYTLEHDPTAWDSYDQFVLAYYWSHRRYDGEAARPRVAHRTGNGRDAYIDLANGIYRLGGTDATLASFDAQPARDYFQWEALYRQQGLYPPEMYHPEGFNDEALLASLQRGDLYLSNVDEMEAFKLHGGSFREATARVDDPSDLGFVAMPRGASLSMDPAGHPARTAERFSFREESVWALPARSPDPSLAYAVVQFALERDNHARECEALGMLPLRTDVIRERASIYRVTWMADVFEAGFAQWPRSEPVPAALVTDGLGDRYARLWDQIVAHRAVGPAQTEALAATLRAPPPARSTEAPTESPTEAPTESPTEAPTEALTEAPTGTAGADLWRARVVIDLTDGGTGTDAGTGNYPPTGTAVRGGVR